MVTKNRDSIKKCTETGQYSNSMRQREQAVAASWLKKFDDSLSFIVPEAILSLAKE